MSFLGSLVGRIEQGAQNAEHTIGNAVNNAVHGGQPQPASTARPQQAQAPFAGPSATSAPIPSFMGNQYAQNPTAPQFRGVDPMIFGYPADSTIPQAYGPRPNLGHLPVGGDLQGYTQDDLSTGLQGGVVNRGDIPLQSSGFGVGVGQGGDAQNLSLRSILNR